jgi:hypothetical protein
LSPPPVPQGIGLNPGLEPGSFYGALATGQANPEQLKQKKQK